MVIFYRKVLKRSLKLIFNAERDSCSSLGATNANAWLGTVNGSDNAWNVNSNGNVNGNNNNNQNSN